MGRGRPGRAQDSTAQDSTAQDGTAQDGTAQDSTTWDGPGAGRGLVDAETGARTGDGRAGTDDQLERARDICLRQLAVRPRTRAELANALRRRGIDDAVADELLARYREVGIVDDEAFAHAWVASRHSGRGLAGRALAGELRRKGVADDTVRDAVAELDPETEAATARELVLRKLRLDRGDRPEATLRRLVGMLARKGYPPGLAIRVVKDAMAEAAESAEFAADLDVDALAEAVGGDV